MLLDTDKNRNIDLLGKKVSIFCRTHIAVGHRIQWGRPGPLQLPSAAGRNDALLVKMTLTPKLFLNQIYSDFGLDL